jgi:hypothetical protein
MAPTAATTTWSGQFRFPQFHGDPAKYSHESWQGYEDAMQLAYVGAGIDSTLNDKVKKAHLLYGLEGKAKEEREFHPEWAEMELDELKIALRKTFNKPKFRDLENIGNIVQKLDESCRSYASRLKQAMRAFSPEAEYISVSKKEARAAAAEEGVEAATKEEVKKESAAYDKVTDKLLLHYFVKHLRPELKKAVIPHRPETLSAALKLAEEHEQYVEMLGGFRQIHMTTTEPQQTLNLQVEPAVKRASQQLTEINNRPGLNSSRRPRPFPDGREQGGSNRPPRRNAGTRESCCYACKQPGHFQRECPQRSEVPQATFRCHYCDKPGHFLKDCRAKAREVEQQRRKNIWEAEKATRTQRPPRTPQDSLLQPRLPSMRRASPEPRAVYPEGRNPWNATGRRRPFEAIPLSPNPRYNRGMGQVRGPAPTSEPKNWQGRGPRAPMTQTLQPSYTKPRRPLVKWQE